MERVPLPDLQDVVFYRQVKDYTDQEYETSKDLKRELAAGRLTLLERHSNIRGTVDGKISTDIVAEIRSVVREVLPAQQANVDVAGLVRAMAPVVADIVRQEVSRLPTQQVIVGTGKKQQSAGSTFVDPTYVPSISTEGMTSSIEAKSTSVSGNDAEDALAMLRIMSGK